jgi:hypothetical protein
VHPQAHPQTHMAAGAPRAISTMAAARQGEGCMSCFPGALPSRCNTAMQHLSNKAGRAGVRRSWAAIERVCFLAVFGLPVPSSDALIICISPEQASGLRIVRLRIVECCVVRCIGPLAVCGDWGTNNAYRGNMHASWTVGLLPITCTRTRIRFQLATGTSSGLSSDDDPI